MPGAARRPAPRPIPPKRVDGRTLRARPRPAAPNGPTERSGPRRQEILDVAALLMQQRGFVGTTVEDVTKALALTKAAFYYYVANKEELLFQISSQTLARTDERISAIAASDRTPERKLGEIVDSFVRLVADRPEFFTVYFQEKGHLAPGHLDRVTRIERKIVKAIERVFREGARSGGLRAVDPTAAAFGLLGLCFWVYKWYRPDGRLAVAQLSAEFRRLAARGYLAAGRRGRAGGTLAGGPD